MKVNFYNINLEIRHEILVQLEYTITSIHYNESETDSRLFKCSPVLWEKMIPRSIPILQDQLGIVDDIRRLSVF